LFALFAGSTFQKLEAIDLAKIAAWVSTLDPNPAKKLKYR
jgi:hypothetical protein